MKFKHVLLSGVLTAVAAVMLLTFVLPQTVEAAGKDHCWSRLCGNDDGGALQGFSGTRAEALDECNKPCTYVAVNGAEVEGSFKEVYNCHSFHNICR